MGHARGRLQVKAGGIVPYRHPRHTACAPACRATSATLASVFYAIPLENKPTWRNPPWLTVLLILINMAVFWGPQQQEEAAQTRATQYYLTSDLPGWEFPSFVRHLESQRSPDAGQARQALRHTARSGAAGAWLLDTMEHDPQFMQALQQHQVITQEDEHHPRRQTQRTRYKALVPAPFTRRWSMEFIKGAPLAPWTWLTAAFLHASTGHLLGNMLFLFLFGFTVELALGRATYLTFYLLAGIGSSAMAMWAYGGRATEGYGLGASGAIAGLMAMYALVYRLRRIRFFYQFFFYFNYVTAPALILLPIWMVNELVQHYSGRQGVGYMTHLGGLLTGTALMLLWPAARNSQPAEAIQAEPDPFDSLVAQAQAYSQKMEFEAACAQWGQAVALRPQDLPSVRAYYNIAKLWPSRTGFHQAAQRVFRLRSHSPEIIAFQHSAYCLYLDKARPSIQMAPPQMAQLASRFARAGHLEDAHRLCQALLASAPQHPATVDALTACAAQLWQRGQREQALTWLAPLQKMAPTHAVTKMLEQG